MLVIGKNVGGPWEVCARPKVLTSVSWGYHALKSFNVLTLFIRNLVFLFTGVSANTNPIGREDP